jgi:hypothetical protein
LARVGASSSSTFFPLRASAVLEPLGRPPLLNFEAAGVFPGVDGGEDEVEFVPPTWAGGRGVEEVDLSTGTMEGSAL